LDISSSKLLQLDNNGNGYVVTFDSSITHELLSHVNVFNGTLTKMWDFPPAYKSGVWYPVINGTNLISLLPGRRDTLELCSIELETGVQTSCTTFNAPFLHNPPMECVKITYILYG